MPRLYVSPPSMVQTSGRLTDFCEAGVTPLNRVTYLVLDEADQLLEMPKAIPQNHAPGMAAIQKKHWRLLVEKMIK